MSVSIVNGYICYSSCDAEKARAGKDPHPKQDALQGMDSAPGGRDPSAVKFGGSLAALNAVTPVALPSAAGSANASTRSTGVDILA